MSIDLTPEERGAVAALEARFSERARFAITIDQLLASWHRFVKEVEGGYQSTIDDYTNDLSTRDLLEEMFQSVAGDLRHKLAARLGPIDERFELATRPDEARLIGQFIRPGQGWWWSRLPVKLVGDLASNLQAAG